MTSGPPSQCLLIRHYNLDLPVVPNRLVSSHFECIYLVPVPNPLPMPQNCLPIYTNQPLSHSCFASRLAVVVAAAAH